MLLVLGGLLVITLSGYSIDTTGTKKRPIDYIKYTRTINNTESYILKKQHDSALVMYNEAFSNVDKPFGRSFFYSDSDQCVYR
ncbi:hypothetical protein JoomaDRAFT_3315 [Galbibacter orientalis DSM 19592]|uniref:Uncharacterized protein n=1 Tax=Galbibacter orientalis DSM 19592 TaxID=926559 RepID=I3C9G7_9FLAO|nr:hypothetical protein JoomaDRAFT_3315 [Galbibacter orientalis DSM 19592]